jgi:hypothetical protein
MKPETIITLQNGKKLNKNQFISYFEKKVFYTIRKYNLFQNEKKNIPDIKDLLIKNKIGSISVSHESLDDISIQVLKLFMGKRDIKKKIKALLPLTHKDKKVIVRPFYFMTKNEIKIYAKLKNIKLEKDKKGTIISSWLDEFEKKHLEVKNAIVNSLLKIEDN